ncbi:MAG TPA: SIS domain-containing protein [Segeticoccus sp.]|uniref:SIS domain-containing protein n=1 Tax=Segeticoccus sp. TaxID=2706531 RepID=UPI002D7FEE37|nr:SIS domain-containing protein [Segeticoccus sp.]HET8598710.1 SIS domain-containing protein [Segeticoccus sp.]
MTTHTSRTSTEIASQPGCWERAADLAPGSQGALPRPGERVAVVGCGTSWFMAKAYAALRERAGQGETDAFPASEMPAGRRYDRIVALTRSGTTTEVLGLLKEQRGHTPTVALTAAPQTPVVDVADELIALPFADEESVVQTRFATSALALLRASLGQDLSRAAADAHTALEAPVEELAALEQVTFVGTGWTVGLADEAALKMREAAQRWTESYPAMEYRHGPLAIGEPGRAVWVFGPAPEGLAADVERTGARLVTSDLDPMAHLVLAQRVAVAAAERQGLDPDRPRHLTRSVILDPS